MVNVHDKLKAEGRCRLCERPNKGEGGRQLTKHRLVPGRFGGRYEYANTVPLCNPCHIDVEAEDPVARRMLRPKLWSIEVAHVMEHMGSVWLEAMYPRPSGPGVTFAEADGFAPESLRERLKPRRTHTQAHSWTIGDRLRVTGQDDLQPWDAAARERR